MDSSGEEYNTQPKIMKEEQGHLISPIYSTKRKIKSLNWKKEFKI